MDTLPLSVPHSEKYPQTLDATRPRSYIVRFALFGALYTVALWLSLYLVPAGGTGASVVWPLSAVGLGILFYWGIDLWPALVMSIFLVLLYRGIAPPLAATTAIGNALESLIMVYLLTRVVEFRPMLSRLRDSLGLIVVSFISAGISASVISLGVWLGNGHTMLNTPLWVGLWIGHSVSLISFGPFVLRWLYRPLFSKTPSELVEGVLLFGSISLINFLLFWTPYSSLGGISLVYISIIPLIWAALRTGPRGVSLSLFLTAGIGATGILFGWGPASHAANLAQTLFAVQMIIGTLSLIFLLFVSITEERKDAVLGLQDHVYRLEEALQKISSEDQAKSDFIAILAHELRNPLSPLLSGLELLKARGEGPDDILRMMGAHLNTTARLLDDLLDMSRISQKKFRLQKEPVEVRALIAQTLGMVEPYLATRRHTLKTALPEGEVWLHGDPVRISQIFVNLLNNAAKYTDEGGTIELIVRVEGKDLVTIVRDSGIGIAPERSRHLFEAFGGHEGNRHSRGGLRIGLSLAKRMAEMHHGIIVARSAGLGAGSEFEVRLPLPQEAPLPLPAGMPKRSRFFKKTPAPGAPHRTLRVLIVDDNTAAADTLAELLKLNGRETSVAYSATEALTRAKTFSPHVALLDIGLPIMDGYQLAQKMHNLLGDSVKLVALTGYGQSEDKQKAILAGFDDHLVKPASASDVERVIGEMIPGA